MNNKLSKIYFDPYLFFSICLLAIFGLFFLYSASNADLSIVIKQAAYIFLGLVIMMVVSQPDPDIFRRTSFAFLCFAVLLLGVTALIGPEINGAQRWVRIGPISFQSSEIPYTILDTPPTASSCFPLLVCYARVIHCASFPISSLFPSHR